MIIAPWLEELSGLQAKLSVFLLQKAPFLFERKTDRKKVFIQRSVFGGRFLDSEQRN